MRRNIAIFMLASAAFFAARAEESGLPTEEPPMQMKITVGKSELLHLMYVAATGTCDDPEVVKVEDAGDALRLVGLKVGSTKCGFWSPPAQARHTLVEITVVKAEPAKH